ncbi:unnamed protein product [Amoebophrya sp. A25]|nr:unnamed protein product [Amoebophrya sp. A25]|eukprot:GSA25T00004308001.1
MDASEEAEDDKLDDDSFYIRPPPCWSYFNITAKRAHWAEVLLRGRDVTQFRHHVAELPWQN